MKQQLRRALVCLTALALLGGIVPVSAAAAGFRDVPAGHWAEDSIQRCTSLGFFQGQSANYFGMGEEISRAAFAVVLCRFYGWEDMFPASPTFQDVGADAWYAGAVEAACAHGAFPRQQPNFRPDDPITRADLAAILVRAMGYGTLAGLAQDLPTHFRDVYANTGYITMAYNLGLMNGTSAGIFSPSRTVPREEVAVTLMRLYDRIHAGTPKVTAVVSAPAEGEPLPDLTGLDAAAIPAGRLMGLGGTASITPTMPAETAARLAAAARKADAKALLHITGGPSALDGPMGEAAAILRDAVRSGGYDGLFLDMPEVKRERRKDLNQFAKILRRELGDIPLYLAVEAPAWNAREYGGYDYTELSALADQLILRVSSYAERGDIFLAPVDPLEEVYYALSSMKGHVELSSLSLMVDTRPAVWNEQGRQKDLSHGEWAELLDSWEHFSSQRYGCTYLIAEDGNGYPLYAWFLDRQSVQVRRQMAQAFGVHHLCLSDWASAFLAVVEAPEGTE